MTTEQDLRKGCGKEGCGVLFKRISKKGVSDVIALCPACQSKLDGYLLAKEEFLKLIDTWSFKWCIAPEKIKELKQRLEK